MRRTKYSNTQRNASGLAKASCIAWFIWYDRNACVQISHLVKELFGRAFSKSCTTWSFIFEEDIFEETGLVATHRQVRESKIAMKLHIHESIHNHVAVTGNYCSIFGVLQKHPNIKVVLCCQVCIQRVPLLIYEYAHDGRMISLVCNNCARVDVLFQIGAQLEHNWTRREKKCMHSRPLHLGSVHGHLNILYLRSLQ